MRIIRLTVSFAVAAAPALLFTLVTPLRAKAVQVLAIVTCASASPCTGGSNTSTGPGVQGTSAKGKGVVGQTKFNSTTSANGQNGILGQDLSTAGSFNTGVTGTSTRGTGVFGRGREGVEGDNVGGNSDALFAKGHGGNLIRANSSVGRDVFVLDNFGNATFGGEVDADAVVAGLVNSASPDIAVNAFGNSIGVEGHGISIGVEGLPADPCNSPCAGLTGFTNGQANSIAVFANGILGAPFLFVGNNSAGRNAFIVDNAGNVHAHSFTADLAATQRTSNGSRLTTYSTENRAPTMEDYGEATLVAGQAYVHLDSTFAAGIDRSRPYLVFLTPQGVVGGTLYVSQKTSTGFAVRETIAARSNVAFDYRIVARPLAKPALPSGVPPATKSIPLTRKPPAIPRRHP